MRENGVFAFVKSWMCVRERKVAFGEEVRNSSQTWSKLGSVYSNWTGQRWERRSQHLPGDGSGVRLVAVGDRWIFRMQQGTFDRCMWPLWARQNSLKLQQLALARCEWPLYFPIVVTCLISVLARESHGNYSGLAKLLGLTVVVWKWPKVPPSLILAFFSQSYHPKQLKTHKIRLKKTNTLSVCL